MVSSIQRLSSMAYYLLRSRLWHLKSTRLLIYTPQRSFIVYFLFNLTSCWILSEAHVLQQSVFSPNQDSQNAT